MPEGLPGLDALAQVCRAFGLNDRDARLLHHRSNAVYLLPHEQIVARLAPATALRRERAATVIALTRWISTRPSPIALPPMPGNQPVVADSAVATFWPYRPTTPPPTLGDLAGLLRQLHELPAPPFSVPRYRPLHRLDEALEIDQRRHQPALTAEDRAWLGARARTLVDAFAKTTFPLAIGLVHADAHRENLVRRGDGWVLIDWDQACLGPRELDLLAGLPDHFHEAEADRTAFLSAYGYDLTRWRNWTLLRDIAELHSVASYIRLAPGKPAAAEELARRVTSLRSGDRSVRWRAVS
ncbi:MAG: phosphotransferase [Actinophytocola sp.]|uniref:phosphotransferase enzyme family protein n=1 Tax=Actinophytocola sp. TaxID=1872138 RepID=UPI001326F363|nr:aminoglycoside phosphotransferase family protein [Actinophytocola sp.]MPZ80265.1 phosphotransferase [Actinophytocola sp.]